MDALLLSLPVLVIILSLVAVYVGENKTVPAWYKRTAFRIRLVWKWVLYIAAIIFSLVVVLPLILQEGAMWLFPESKFGYTMKYEIADEKVVVIDRKPHDCEWETAPLGQSIATMRRPSKLKPTNMAKLRRSTSVGKKFKTRSDFYVTFAVALFLATAMALPWPFLWRFGWRLGRRARIEPGTKA